MKLQKVIFDSLTSLLNLTKICVTHLYISVEESIC